MASRRQPALLLPDCGRANDERSGRGKSAYPRDIRAVIYAAFKPQWLRARVTDFGCA
jgi:hypothetical protein